MCRPTESANNNNGDDGLKEVVISGAGPAGLLLTALLMQRNKELPEPLYKITLLDNRDDLGSMEMEELKKSHRSWMLGLAGHGCKALQACEGLYEEYCKPVGIQVNSLCFYLGSTKMEQKATQEDMENNENLIVDRNFIVAAIARFVQDTTNKDQQEGGFLQVCETLYRHKILYVDYENRRVLIRNLDNNIEFYKPYDLLVGCDGIRSVVRESLVKRHSSFEMDVGDIFQQFKAVHVELPPSLDQNSMHLFPGCFPDMQGIGLPETGGKINISIGGPRHLFNNLPNGITSNDPKIVAKYVKENFKAFDLVDYDDFARQWVKQKWNRTGQVHCNFYHSNDINVVIMGDAAHATSPSIGMGMNTALRDAQTFYNLLREHKDDLEMVLPAFSKDRVKEGNSLTDLAMHLYCMDTSQQMKETLHLVIRSALHKMFPSLVAEHPQTMIGNIKYNLSDVYDQSTLLGVIGPHRRINNNIRQSYFEETTGMVSAKTRAATNRSISKTLLQSAVATAVVAAGYWQWTTM